MIFSSFRSPSIISFFIELIYEKIILITVVSETIYNEGDLMSKGYFLSAHRSPANPEKRNLYLELAGPAIVKSDGKVLASTNIVDAHENGVSEQTVLVEFESLEKAKSFYYGPDYQLALKGLGYLPQ